MIQGLWDYRQRLIPTRVSVVAGIIGVVISWITERSLIDFIVACLPGILCLCIARLTNQVIGYGDGIVLCSLGTICSLEEILHILMMAFFWGGVVAIVLLVIFRKKGNYEIPFVPFLFIGWLVDMLFLGGK